MLKPKAEETRQPLRRQRIPSPLLHELDKLLRSYTLAASAAGVGLLASARPATAQVVYTPARVILSSGDLFLDLNCGPTINFWLADIHEHSSYGQSQELEIQGSTNASVLVDAVKGDPAALAAGSVIGSSRSFKNVQQGEHLLANAYWGSYYHIFSGVGGNWAHAKQAYLGLKFDIQGQVHYGWAELSVLAAVDHNLGLHMNATLTGYAYDATPNQPINAGKRTGNSGEAAVPPLAQGRERLRELARGAGGCPDNDR